MQPFASAMFAKSAAAAAPFAGIASLFAAGEAGGYWDFTDLASLRIARDGTGAPPAVGDPVGWAADKSGNGNHLSTNADNSRFTAVADGAVSDGVNDTLYRMLSPSIGPPFEVVICFEQLAYAGADKRILAAYIGSWWLLQGPASGDVRFFDGIYGPTLNAGLARETVVDGYFNGGYGSVAINGGAMQSAPGTGQSLDAILLGTDASGQHPTSIRFKQLLIIGRALTASERAAVVAAMQA